MPDLTDIDTSRPHEARMYDYFIGGKNHFVSGLVLVSEWRPDDPGPRPTPAEVSCYGGVARKD